MTDNGNFILDWLFPASVTDWETVNNKIKMIPGQFTFLRLREYYVKGNVWGLRVRLHYFSQSNVAPGLSVY